METHTLQHLASWRKGCKPFLPEHRWRRMARKIRPCPCVPWSRKFSSTHTHCQVQGGLFL